MDEALAQAAVDLSGRPYFVHGGEPAGQEFHLIGGHFTGSLTRHVFESIAYHAAISLNIQLLSGRDPHHIVEVQFKALRSEEHTSELQSRGHLVCRLLLEKKKTTTVRTKRGTT